MAWIARELYQVEDRCLVQLGRLYRRLHVEPGKYGALTGFRTY